MLSLQTLCAKSINYINTIDQLKSLNTYDLIKGLIYDENCFPINSDDEINYFIKNEIIITNILLGDYFDNVSLIQKLSSLKKIVFGQNFNMQIKPLECLFNLKILCLGNGFNQSIEPIKNLKQLNEISFGYSFNQPIDALSNCIQLSKVTFGFSFNQPIDALSNCIQLSKISFRNSFSQLVNELFN